MATQESFEKLEASLLNTPGNVPLHARFRSLFTLKSLPGQQSIDIISKGFGDESALLKHELAYVLGQMGDSRAIPTLCNVLSNEEEDPMVRHEAAEALGALSAESAKPLLEKYLTCPERAVRETCEIALDKIKWDATPEGQAANKRAKEMKEQGTAQYTSVDPAPASSSAHSKLVANSGTPSKHDSSPDTIADLRALLMDTSKPLFERYRAMFALRDIGTASAVNALAVGLSDSSALFKHEIAFVFGQLLSPHSVPALIKTLEDANEDEMVRHEAAEALGGIATPEVLPILREWASKPDAPRVVRESCVVALDMYEAYRCSMKTLDNSNMQTVYPLGPLLSLVLSLDIGFLLRLLHIRMAE
ncbi:deoxyhypusine hydroxylase [Ceratobasidium sp. 428]|nr:deoxyhypusine hydroxylase [Ceratobasidium sp. 428]